MTTESIAQLPQSDKGYLTVQDIADMTHVSYKTVRQYAELDAVRKFMGAYEHPGSKGVRWPEESGQKWIMLLDTAQKGLIQPSTAAAWLANIEVSPSIAQMPTLGKHADSEAIALLPQLGNEAVSILRNMDVEVVSLLRQLVNQTPLPDNCLLDATQAGAILCCKPASVRRYVRPVRRGRWRKSDVLRHIQELNQIG